MSSSSLQTEFICTHLYFILSPLHVRTRVELCCEFQVIFSQTSELLERQSSMASSTEEVSGGNMDVSTAESSRHHDTTDTEQRFGIYMREFDFLDCEVNL